MTDRPKLPKGLPAPDWCDEEFGVALYCGDCLDILPKLPRDSCRMIFTDPPYGHGNADSDFLARRGDIMVDGNSTRQKPIASDDMNGMRDAVDAMLGEAVRVLLLDYCCCCCCCGGGGPRPTFAWLAERMDRDGLSFFHSVIWDKANPGIGWRYRRQHEMVMVAHRRGGSIAWNDKAKKQANVIRLSKPRDWDHPNQKPLDLVSLFVRNHASRNDIVIDPFMGSGTTGVAAVNLGRAFIGIEIDSGYFAIAVERIRKAIVEAQAGPLFAEHKPAQLTLMDTEEVKK